MTIQPIETNVYISPTYSEHRDYDIIEGQLCSTCRLVWIGGFTPAELGLEDDDDSLSASAQAFVESAAVITVQAEPVSSSYRECTICDTVIIECFPATVEIAA